MHFFVYIEALERLQMNMATPNDLFGSDSKSLGVLLRVQEHSQKRSSIFALGERINILKVYNYYHLVELFHTLLLARLLMSTFWLLVFSFLLYRIKQS